MTSITSSLSLSLSPPPTFTLMPTRSLSLLLACSREGRCYASFPMEKPMWQETDYLKQPASKNLRSGNSKVCEFGSRFS